LRPLDDEILKGLVDKALVTDFYLSQHKVTIKEYEALIRISGGDARKLYNALELTVSLEAEKGNDEIIITDELVLSHVQQNLAMYDKNGEQHFDIISAFIKSMRGSDPNASVYWLARMVEGGEDVKFIARRMVILAAEDIGLANPNALLLAQACFNAVSLVGWPESRIILSETTIYLATSPKSNASYMAIENAIAAVHQHGHLPVPLNLRNAPTKLMKDLGYHKGYRYAHDFEDNFVADNYLPEEITGTIFYEPGSNAREDEIRKQLAAKWQKIYKYPADRK
ncbi:MAG: replication-associated recombination protein A, partial [Bacteroidales bacterium]